tara:strand:- start:7433 stop:8047 length:615 start_codon:yes stop_codon:yes gene_type:complete
MDNPIIVGIAGASASGKTRLANNLVGKLSIPCTIISEDHYYKDQSHLPEASRDALNYDTPSAFDHALLCTHIQQLKSGKSIECPKYDFKTHCRRENFSIIEPTPVIIIDGILLLADAEIREQLDIAVFIDTPLDICLIRRIQRDRIERGRLLEDIIDQYQASVRPMYYKYVKPSMSMAHYVVNGGGDNWEAIDILKSQIMQTMS